MRKWLPITILLFAFYFIFQFFMKMYGNGYQANYEVYTDENKFHVEETYTANFEKDINNYHFLISNDKDTFSIQIFNDLKKSEEVIADIYYKNADNYSCIFPIFKNNIIATDIVCLKDGMQYNYQAIQGQSNAIDAFAEEMKEKGYKKENYVDQKENPYKEEITLYRGNILENYSFAFSTYKGVNIVTNLSDTPIKKFEFFEKDVYDQSLVTLVNNYYLAPDYNKSHEFNQFYLANINNLSYETISAPQAISFDSYIQGIVDNKVYLYDRDNNIQYEIELSKKKVNIVGNEKNGYKVYINGTWTNKALKDMANNTILFTEKEGPNMNGFTFLKETEKEHSGYYYYYKQVGNQYEIYRANKQTPEKLTLLTRISSLSSMKFIHDYFYYINGDTINYYHDLTGVRTLLVSNELKFNRKLDYTISAK